MNYISLRELRGLVKRTKGRKLPTAKALRESGAEVVARAEIGADAALTVYRNGFFTYSAAGGTTVYAVDRCAGYAYDDGEVLDAELFDGGEWTLRLMMAGEDRLEHNRNAREEKKRLYYKDDHQGGDLERDEIRDPGDFTLNLESKEAVDRLLDVLTDRQRKTVELYFMEGLTQQEIAERLGIGQRSVSYALEAAVKKIKKVF